MPRATITVGIEVPMTSYANPLTSTTIWDQEEPKGFSLVTTQLEAKRQRICPEKGSGLPGMSGDGQAAWGQLSSLCLLQEVAVAGLCSH